MPQAPNFNQMPLYPDEDQIALAVMGPKRAKEWRSKAKFLEDKHHLPRVDVLMGGRYWPAVKWFFDNYNGVATVDGASVPPSVSRRIRIVPPPPDAE